MLLKFYKLKCNFGYTLLASNTSTTLNILFRKILHYYYNI